MLIFFRRAIFFKPENKRSHCRLNLANTVLESWNFNSIISIIEIAQIKKPLETKSGENGECCRNFRHRNRVGVCFFRQCPATVPANAELILQRFFSNKFFCAKLKTQYFVTCLWFQLFLVLWFVDLSKSYHGYIKNNI